MHITGRKIERLVIYTDFTDDKRNTFVHFDRGGWKLRKLTTRQLHRIETTVRGMLAKGTLRYDNLRLPSRGHIALDYVPVKEN